MGLTQPSLRDYVLISKYTFLSFFLDSSATRKRLGWVRKGGHPSLEELYGSRPARRQGLRTNPQHLASSELSLSHQSAPSCAEARCVL